MRTIAITVDEVILTQLDRIVRDSSSSPGVHGQRPNRSRIVRIALEEFVTRHERQHREDRDRAAIAAHRARIQRQAKALVGEQADL